MINVDNTDAINGRDPARQMGLWISYLLGTFALFFVTQEILILLVWFGFGYEVSQSFAPYTLPCSIIILGAIVANSHTAFWVNPTGNKVQATINMLNPGQLDDGGTLFIVYTAGFALKWPWERLYGKEVEIEREEIIPTEDFTVTVANTALTMNVSIAWKPHMGFLSSYLQNGSEILEQIVSKCKQYIEEEASCFSDPDHVRAHQGFILEIVHERLQKFADWLGVEIFDLSMSKCDYDVETQKRLNKHIETKIVANMVQQLRENNEGLSPEKAGELAAVMAGIEGVKINRNVFEIVATPEVAKAIENAGPAIQAALMARTAQK